MSRFTDKLKPVRVTLSSGDWVEIRQRIKYGDRVELQRALFGVKNVTDMVKLQNFARQAKAWKEGDPEPAVPEIDLRTSNIETVVHALAAWGGFGFCSLADHDQGETHPGDCVPRPITYQNVEVLDDISDELLEAIQKVLKTETQDFTPPASQPSDTAVQVATRQPEADSANSR